MSKRRGSLVAIAAVSLSSFAGAEPSADVPPAAVVGELPFLESKELNRVIVDLAPAGSRPFRMLLDTGAEGSVMTPLYARELGVNVRRAREEPYQRATVLGRELQFWVDTQSSESASRTGWEYGLLGGNFLANYVVELDFPHRKVRFIDPDQFQVPKSVDAPGEAVLPLRVAGNRPFLDVQVEGKTADVLLDTGAPLTLSLSGASARRAHFEKPPLSPLAAAGVLGKIEAYLVEADELKLGPFAFAPAPIELAPHGNYNQGGSTDSFIGYELLQHFRVRLDYPRQRIWLQRADTEPLGWFGRPWAVVRRTGLLAEVGEHGIEVDAVLPDSAASKLGVLPGDEIEFHGDPPRDQALEEALAAIEAGGPLTVVRVANDQPTQVKLGTK